MLALLKRHVSLKRSGVANYPGCKMPRKTSEEIMARIRIGLLAVLITLPGAVLASISIETQNIRIYNEELVAPNGGMTRPRLIQYDTPDYTVEAISNGVEGTVSVLAEFDIDGNFKVLRILKGLGYGLDEQALEALSSYRFGPAYQSGRRVSVIATIDVEFKLPDPGVVSLPGGFFYVNGKLILGEAELDPTVTEYIQRVGEKIIENSDAKVPFAIKVIAWDQVSDSK